MTPRRVAVLCLLVVLLAGVALLLRNATAPPDKVILDVMPDVAVTSIAPPRTRPPTPVNPALTDYVGSAACRDCHAEIWERYQSHPMAHSFAKVLEATPVEDYVNKTTLAPPGNRRYRVERTPEGVWHHESMLDAQGQVIYDQSARMDYTLGSGKRGRSYVLDNEGLLFKSSLSWFSDKHEWGLSPGYAPEGHKRFERRVTGGCVSCHAGLPNSVPGDPDRFGQPTFLEEAIGCERCHGAGRKHIALWDLGEGTEETIVNPGRLEMERRESVCANCHLHGESRVSRIGRTEHDFRPGQRFDDTWTVFVKEKGSGLTQSGRAASQVEQMVGSACFRGSDGKMGCISCHDPHSVPNADEKNEFFRQRCLNCHADRGCSLPLPERQAAPHHDRCVACHMPSVNSTNVLHRSIADHRILRRPVPAEETAESGKSVVFHFAQNSVPEAELQRARAFKLVSDALGPPLNPALARRAAEMLRPLIDQYPQDPEILMVLGNSYQLQNQPREAVRWWLKALELAPGHEATVQNLATVLHDQFQLGPAEKHLKEFLKLNPWHGSYHGRLAGTLNFRGDKLGAIAEAERALELNPTLTDLHDFLAATYAEIGNEELAEKHRRLAVRKRSLDGPQRGAK